MLRMTRGISSRLTLVTQVFLLKETIQTEERTSERDIIAIILDQKLKPDTGAVEIGKLEDLYLTI
jgi:hypothetical protein